jgi:hypothetical protein
MAVGMCIWSEIILPCGCKINGLDGTISAALLAFEQKVHQLNAFTLNKSRPAIEWHPLMGCDEES